MTQGKHNHLINETSPYLLQHSHNPVNWHAWGEKALERARKSGKLMIISIGYSSCHWCHVMEEECFEDELAANVMNEHFINIKVDREERPDIDHIYMTALQLMTGRGGWPLNVVALPDGRPVWAASYVPKRRWIIILEQIAELYKNDRAKLIEIAEKVSAGISQNDLVDKYVDDHGYSPGFVKSVAESWSRMLDYKYGGYNYSPKFPLPNNYEFLLKYSYLIGDNEIMNYVFKTLDMMAFGGIYDQIEGGFSRYSTDSKWHIPHFEKMLYDNAQLVSLYSSAYAITKKPLYLEVIEETLGFVQKELTGEIGNFYSALDADSLNDKDILEEGAYYTWEREELEEILGDDFELFSDYYNINNYGHWEHGRYVLIRTEEDESFAIKHGISYSELKILIKEWKNVLANVKNAENLKDAPSSKRKKVKRRKKRNKPRLDDKSLCSWNALMIKAYADAYNVTARQDYLDSARRNAEFILSNLIQDDGSLYHNYAGGRACINGFLEDYSILIQAFISLYQADLDEKWLRHAKKYLEHAIKHFYDDKSGMFFFTSDCDTALISRSIETYDGVISSGNSIMARNLFILGHYFQISSYHAISVQMLKNMLGNISSNGPSYSNWLTLYLDFGHEFYEIAVTGPQALEFASDIKKAYLPDGLIAASAVNSELPLLQNRYSNIETNIFVCVDGACKMPVKTTEEAIALLKQKK